MAKFWFGSLEQIEDQHIEDGKTQMTTYRAVKGWRVQALEEYKSEVDKVAARNQLAEIWWKDAEEWWGSQQVNKDLKGNITTMAMDYTPIRETGDFQLRITGPIDPNPKPEPNKPQEPVHTDKEGGKTLDKKGKTL